jgi:hypothetical protein
MGAGKNKKKEIAIEAYETGIKHADCTGRLHKYVTWLYFQYEKANAIRIFHEKVFLFRGRTLITIINLPSNLRSLAKKTEHNIDNGKTESLVNNA